MGNKPTLEEFSQAFDAMSFEERYELAVEACKHAKKTIDDLKVDLEISEQGRYLGVKTMKSLVDYIRGTGEVDLNDSLRAADMLILLESGDMDKLLEKVEDVLNEIMGDL